MINLNIINCWGGGPLSEEAYTFISENYAPIFILISLGLVYAYFKKRKALKEYEG